MPSGVANDKEFISLKMYSSYSKGNNVLGLNAKVSYNVLKYSKHSKRYITRKHS